MIHAMAPTFLLLFVSMAPTILSRKVETMEFRECVGHPGYYVSDTGEVRSKRCKSGIGIRDHVWRKLKLQKTAGPYEYYCVKMCAGPGGKHRKRRVHCLELEAFEGPCPPGMECRHLDGNGLNNLRPNLKWGTPKENSADRGRHGTQARGSRQGRSKLIEADIPAIREMLQEGVRQADIARHFGVTDACIFLIKKGRNWRHV